MFHGETEAEHAECARMLKSPQEQWWGFCRSDCESCLARGAGHPARSCDSCLSSKAKFRCTTGWHEGVHTTPSQLKTRMVTHPFFPEETGLCPRSWLPTERATCFIKTKEIARAKRGSVTTCHFISASTCQRMTQKAATCHPLTEHIKLLFVKHFNSNQEKISFMNHDAFSVNENEWKSHFLELETNRGGSDSAKDLKLKIYPPLFPPTIAPPPHIRFLGTTVEVSKSSMEPFFGIGVVTIST